MTKRKWQPCPYCDEKYHVESDKCLHRALGDLEATRAQLAEARAELEAAKGWLRSAVEIDDAEREAHGRAVEAAYREGHRRGVNAGIASHEIFKQTLTTGQRQDADWTDSRARARLDAKGGEDGE